MLDILKLGWRNIWRNTRRTLVSMSAIALGLAFVLIAGSVMGRVLGDAKNQLDNTGLGHVEITAKDWRAHRAAKAAMATPEATLAKVTLPPLSEVGMRLLARGLLSGAHGNAAVEVDGVDFVAEANLSEFVRHISQGAVPAADDAKGVLIGDRLAVKLHLAVGNKVRLMVQRADGEMGAELFRVRGTYHALSSSISERRVLVTRAALGDVLGTPHAAHDIVIQLEHPNEAAVVAASARAALGADFEVVTYAELYPIFATMESLTDSVNVVASMFVYFLVGLGILNTTLMSVLERTRELGVMQALGTRPSRIVALILAESFWIGTLSVVLGLAIGLGVCWAGSSGGLLDYRKTMGEGFDLGGAVMSSMFSTRVDVSDAVGPTIFVYVMALIVGLYPAWRITRLRIVEALHAK